MRLDDPTAAPMARRAQPGLRLLRAEDVYAHVHLIEAQVPICEWAWRLYPPQFIDRVIPDLSRRRTLDGSVVIHARVESGRWIAECAFCASAQVVSPLDPRFLCAGLDGCANAAVKGAWVPVAFPIESEREAIEGVLLKRPERMTRNWKRPEAVNDLIAENIANGVGA